MSPLDTCIVFTYIHGLTHRKGPLFLLVVWKEWLSLCASSIQRLNQVLTSPNGFVNLWTLQHITSFLGIGSRTEH